MKIRPSSFEVLEDRIAPAGVVTASIDNNILFINGDTDANSLTLSVVAPGVFRLTGNGTTIAFEGAAAVATVDFSQVFTGITADLGAGGDTLGISGIILTKNLNLNGGAGADTITLSSVQVRGTSLITSDDATAGADAITVGGASRFASLRVDAGAGDDTISTTSILQASGKVELLGGAGVDTFSLGGGALSAASLLIDGGTEGNTINLTPATLHVPGALTVLQGAHTTTGTINLGGTQADLGSVAITLAGTTNNVILGSAGAILAVKGNVTVTGGSGMDNFGFNGTSVSAGNLKYLAGDGNDTLTTNPALANLQLASLSFDGGTGGDVVSLIGTGDVRIKGAATFTLGEDGNTLNANARAFSVGGLLKVTGGAGTDNISFNPSALFSAAQGISVSTGAGNGSFTLAAPSVTVGKTLSVTSDTATGEGVQSTISTVIAKIGTVKITGGDGNEFVQTSLTGASVGALTFNGGAGDDFAFIDGAGLRLSSLTSNLGDGSNTTLVTGEDLNITGAVNITGGTGTDSVSFSAAALAVSKATTVNLGAGNSNVTLVGNGYGLAFVGGLKLVASGLTGSTDSFTGTNFVVGKSTLLTFGAGASTVAIDNYNTNGTLAINTGDGADTVNIERAGQTSISRILKTVNINLGAGADTIGIGRGTSDDSVSFGLKVTIDGGADADTASNDFENDNDFALPIILGLKLTNIETIP